MNNIDEFHQAAINVAHKHGYKPTEVIIYSVKKAGVRLTHAATAKVSGDESASFESALESFENKLKEYHGK